MDYLITAVGDLSLGTVLIWAAALGFLISLLNKVFQFLTSQHDSFKDKEELFDDVINELKEIKQDTKELKEKFLGLEERQKQAELRQAESEAAIKEQKLNELRDRLLQSYRYYVSKEKNPLGQWTEMEHEVFEGLFRSYEQLGGNGFVHSVVRPEVELLEIIPMSEKDKVLTLMKSRKG